MEENVTVNQDNLQPEVTESKGKKFLAACKEWLRKQTVSLKRAPQRIPLVFTVIVSILWLVWLFTFSQSINYASANLTGIAVFLNTILSILIMPMFLNAFPKRKGTNWVFFGLIFVFILGIILSDVLYYVQMNNYLGKQDASLMEQYPCLNKSLTLSIVHIVLNAISAVLLATLPLYSKLIRKINTRKVVETNELKEEIDTSAEV